MGLFSRLKNLFSRRKPVLGLALGSGGAKGMAHLGAIKAFEEAGLSFSVVAGTSIGAIVGALYAEGYSSADMRGIVEGLNRREFARNLNPFSEGSPVESFLSGYLEGDLSATRLPFAACATDGATGELAVLKKGPIARSLAASSAIPPYFRGVEIGGRKYYDGAFTDAVPADVCRELGADFVVGIDLSAFVPPDEERGRVSRLVSALLPVKNKPDCKSRGYAAADVMLRPNLGGFTATAISREAMDKMYELGYSEAKERIPEIMLQLKKKRHERRKK